MQMNKNTMNNQFDKYADKTENVIHKGEHMAEGMIQKADDIATDMVHSVKNAMHSTVNKTSEMMHKPMNEYMEEAESMTENALNNTVSYVSSAYQNAVQYAKQHPALTATVALTAATMMNSTTRQMAKPLAKYAIKHPGKLLSSAAMLIATKEMAKQTANTAMNQMNSMQ